MAGVEPALPQQETDFKSVVSTNSTTSALPFMYYISYNKKTCDQINQNNKASKKQTNLRLS